MRQLRPVPSAHHSSSSPAGRVLSSLLDAKQVYVRPLQCPYDGPFEVISPGRKSFIIRSQGQPYTVSTDRLKAAVTPQQMPAIVPDQPPTEIPLSDPDHFPPLPNKTSFGRIIRPPQRLNL